MALVIDTVRALREPEYMKYIGDEVESDMTHDVMWEAAEEIEDLRKTNRELVAQIAKMHSDYGPVIEQVNAQVAAIKRESAQ